MDFVFNVDLMHPTEAQNQPELFNDILDLGAPDEYDPRGPRRMKSICFPSAKIIFEKQLWTPFTIPGTSHQIPLMDEVGLILSKCISGRQAKRPRDAFDIYFVLQGVDGTDVAQRLRQMAKADFVDDQLESLELYLNEKPKEFDHRVAKYCNTENTEKPSTLVMQMLFD